MERSHLQRQEEGRADYLLSARSVLFPTNMIMTSLPLSVLTSSIHFVVCWKELTSERKWGEEKTAGRQYSADVSCENGLWREGSGITCPAHLHQVWCLLFELKDCNVLKVTYYAKSTCSCLLYINMSPLCVKRFWTFQEKRFTHFLSWSIYIKTCLNMSWSDLGHFMMS